MSNSRPPRASGFFIALAVIAGAVIGARLGQPSLGVLAGIGCGVLVALLLWVADRR